MIERHRAKGFTLIELLVTLAVAIILVTVAVPSFRDTMIRQRFATELNSVLLGLNLARSEAIKRRDSVSFVVTQAGGVANGTEWRWEVRDDSGVVRQASGSGRIALSVGGPSRITFGSLGRIEGGSCDDECTISLKGDNRPRYYGIKINGYGLIARLEEAPEAAAEGGS